MNLALKQFLENEVEPLSAEGDHSFATLNKLFKLLGERGFYGLSVQANLSNKAISKKESFDNRACLTKHSGALSFLNSQIDLSSNLLHQGQNESLKQTILAPLLKGQIRIANGVSHLRSDVAHIQVQKTQEGFILNGKVHWITGFGHCDYFVMAFCDAECEYFALLPFRHLALEGLTFSEPLQVMVMQATHTVRATLDNCFIANEQIINTQEKGFWYQQMKNSQHILPYFYGIAVGALEVIQAQYQKENTYLQGLWDTLQLLREQITAEGEKDLLDYRVNITRCAYDCLQAAIVVSKGKAMDPNSKISRLYREIVQFNALAALEEYVDRSLQSYS
ncbi:MAG: hypothetical protein JSR17_12765 [Proteobacteria bacterium]|nr:hypothetical protein [Pseudomonadota bacterium]